MMTVAAIAGFDGGVLGLVGAGLLRGKIEKQELVRHLRQHSRF